MSRFIAGSLRLLFRMGIIFMLVSLAGLAVLAASILLPPSLLTRLTGSVRGWLGLQQPAYSMMAPDELVHDFALGADVPRIYYLSIPSIELHAPVVAVDEVEVVLANRRLRQSHVPHAFAAGWSQASSPVGARGNTVFVGHNNVYGEVFKDVWQLQSGDRIIIQTASGDRIYRVSKIVTFDEKDQPIEQRLANAAWIAPTRHEQLTLITCWPYFTNTHRLVVVALPEPS